MTSLSVNALLQSLREVVHGFIDHILRDFIPRCHQTLLQCLNRLMGLRARFIFQNAPQRIVQHIQVRGIRRPITVVSLRADVDFDGLREAVLDQVLCFDGLVRWSPVLLENPVLLPLSVTPSVNLFRPWQNLGSQKFKFIPKLLEKSAQNKQNMFTDRTFAPPCRLFF